ncbi:nucleolar protein 7 [Pygocentrus nattereri]|nr:nucleolar protein 7 [Pygocentrus nattereri]
MSTVRQKTEEQSQQGQEKSSADQAGLIMCEYERSEQRTAESTAESPPTLIGPDMDSMERPANPIHHILKHKTTSNMAKLQRGDPQLKSEKQVKFGREISESSEDEGPEEVAFEESKSVALKSAEEALRARRREKELLKEKRRKKQLFFQEQKKKSLLSEALLEEFDTVPQKKKKLSVEKEESKNEEKEENMQEIKSQKASRSLQGNCSVMRVKDKAADESLQQSAMDFIRSRLYGPGKDRTTNAELLSLEKKRGANQGAAVQFVNKKLGAEQKAKAEKCNKRFIRKQKLIPS